MTDWIEDIDYWTEDIDEDRIPIPRFHESCLDMDDEPDLIMPNIIESFSADGGFAAGTRIIRCHHSTDGFLVPHNNVEKSAFLISLDELKKHVDLSRESL